MAGGTIVAGRAMVAGAAMVAAPPGFMAWPWDCRPGAGKEKGPGGGCDVLHPSPGPRGGNRGL